VTAPIDDTNTAASKRPKKRLVDYYRDFDGWYVDVIQKSEMAEDAPVRGCKVVRPYAYAIWEAIQDALDSRFKATGVQNAYFPLFIPKPIFEKEADHIEGFAPEVAWVTRGGTQELEEPWAVRPSSESIICPMFAKWVQSWRDLPILINQWCSVVRWEERPRAFLRTLEFLWQEGHTCHATFEEADERARQMLDAYRDVLESELAVPVVPGTKSESERFAGAEITYTVEAMMGGKFWALQAGTSHNLSDHFGRVFGIEFLDRDGERRFAFNTSFGFSHRTIGAMVMVHGDEAGLKVPPRVAPIQVVVLPIRRGGGEGIDGALERVQEQLRPVARFHVDDREQYSVGYKIQEWELKGVPIRLDLGPEEVANDRVTLVRRDTGVKIQVPVSELAATVPGLLSTIQQNLFATAQEMLDDHTAEVNDYAELAERAATNAGWSLIAWCGDAECETKIKNETKATIRCIPFEQPERVGRCVVCGGKGKWQVVVGRAY
jgi:prolyl-tRNA synthetase